MTRLLALCISTTRARRCQATSPPPSRPARTTRTSERRDMETLRAPCPPTSAPRWRRPGTTTPRDRAPRRSSPRGSTRSRRCSATSRARLRPMSTSPSTRPAAARRPTATRSPAPGAPSSATRRAAALTPRRPPPARARLLLARNTLGGLGLQAERGQTAPSARPASGLRKRIARPYETLTNPTRLPYAGSAGRSLCVNLYISIFY